LERVALSVARILGQFFDSNMVMGIAWGSTMNAISRHVTPKQTHGSQIIQLNGAGNMRTTGLSYASEILGRFGYAFGAHVHQFPVPAFFDSPATKEALWRERSVSRLLAMQARMDVALFGLGSPFSEVPSHVYAGGYLEEPDYASLSRAGVVGDVATIFYRADGSTHDIPLNARGTGPDFDVLRQTPRPVRGVGHGETGQPAGRPEGQADHRFVRGREHRPGPGRIRLSVAGVVRLRREYSATGRVEL
jgi:deoxyribonucleoside regulator